MKMVSIISLFLLTALSCAKQDGFAPGLPSTLLSGSIEFTSSAAGQFDLAPAGSKIEKTLEIKSVDGVVLSGVRSSVSLPFKYKGGAYPGVGGTCGVSISQACTVVLNFEPTAEGGFAKALNFSYEVSGVVLSSTLPLTGSAVLPPPTDLAIAGSKSVERNQCVSFIVNAIISGNINSPVVANTPVQLAVNSGSATFYSDMACSHVITSTVIAAGQFAQTVFLKSTTAPQTPTLVATSSGYGSGTKVITVASSPTQLLLASPAQAIVNECRLLTISRLDAGGLEVASLSTTTMNLSENGSMQYFSDSECSQAISSTTIPSGASNTLIYVMNTVAESILVSVSDAAAVLTASAKTIHFVSTLQWWNASFSKRIQITLDNKDQTASFSNQAVLVRLDSSVVAYSNMKADGSDIRFIGADHTTVYSHQIEKWDVNGYSYVWVKLPSIAASSDATLFMYFGNPAANAGEDALGTWSRYGSVWHLGESPDGVAPQFTDLGTGARHGTASNGPNSTTGIIGNAIDFNGALDSIDVGNLAPVLGATATLSFWVNTSMTGHDTNYVAPGVTGIELSGGTNDIFWGWIDASGHFGITAGDGVGAKSALKINDNVWRHVAISRNSTTGAVAFYVNGVLNSSSTSGIGIITQAFSKFGVIEKTAGGSPADFNGKLDEIRIEARVMTADQIKADFKFQNNSQLVFGQMEIY